MAGWESRRANRYTTRRPRLSPDGGRSADCGPICANSDEGRSADCGPICANSVESRPADCGPICANSDESRPADCGPICANSDEGRSGRLTADRSVPILLDLTTSDDSRNIPGYDRNFFLRFRFT